MDSLRRLALSTGFMPDSETSSMMDQYGPGWGSFDLGDSPEASWRVGSFLEAAG